MGNAMKTPVILHSLRLGLVFRPHPTPHDRPQCRKLLAVVLQSGYSLLSLPSRAKK